MGRFAVRSVVLFAVVGLMVWRLAEARGDMGAEAFRRRPLAEKLATPQQTIETLCFASDAYSKVPDIIADAVACLDVQARDFSSEGTRELLALELEEVLSDLALPFRTLMAPGDDKTVIFFQDAEVRIALARGLDGLWRFDRETVSRISRMRRVLAERSKRLSAARAGLREGMGDPTQTMVTFLKHAADGDFDSAALRLDPGDLPPDQRQRRGKQLAWMLACVVHRRGYLFKQAIPADPDGPPYTWSADRFGRIAVARVRHPGGKDRWQFTRETVAAIEAMWRAVRDRPPDPRYAVLGQMVSLEAPPAEPEQSSSAPASVPERYSTPRRMVRAFLSASDEAEFLADDARLKDAYSFLDLSHFPPEDLRLVGPKRAEMLGAVLRKIHPDPGILPDQWGASRQVVTGPGNLRLEIVRQNDGCWRFDDDTVTRLPAMYETITSKEKAESEQQHGLGTPRETLVTFLHAIDRGDDAEAARCLDLSAYPTSARDNIGPVLAFKLKYCLNRLGRIYLAEIHSDSDGPQVVLYRGGLGRVVVARREDAAGNRLWGFTSATVRHTEELFNRMIGQAVAPDIPDVARTEPSLTIEPGVWIRTRVPAWLQGAHFGIIDYQWLGLVILLGAVWGVSVLARGCAIVLLNHRFGMPAADPADQAVIRGKLRSLQMMVFLLTFYHFFECLDIPADIAAHVYLYQKLLLIVALVWVGFDGINLGRLFYQRSDRLRKHRGLGDLVVPFVSNVTKVALILAAATYLIHQFGQGETLTRFFAGIGIAGVAVSLAAQDSLKNLFGTLFLIGDRSFRIGDRLVIGDKEGIVEHVGFRSTTLRTPGDTALVLPNALLATGVIDNLGLRAYRRTNLMYLLATQTSLDTLVAVRDQVRAWLAGYARVDSTRVQVHVQRVNDRGIELEVQVYAKAEDDKAVREEVSCEVIRLVRQAGAEFAVSLPPAAGADGAHKVIAVSAEAQPP